MLAIAGGKGGGGKTTTAIGLAAATDDPTLVVDADVDMPDLHAMAGVARSPTLADLAPGDDPLALARSHPAFDGVSILPAPTATDDGSDPTAVVRALDACRRVDARVVVDCPSSAGPDGAAPLRAADAVALASPACAPALQDAARTAAMARALDATVAGAVLTRTRVAPPPVADLLGCPVVATVPSVDPPVLQRPPVREAYRRAARHLWGSRASADGGPPGSRRPRERDSRGERVPSACTKD